MALEERRGEPVLFFAADLPRQDPFGAAMPPISELEYTGIMGKLAALDGGQP